jgi:hypothetical protein
VKVSQKLGTMNDEYVSLDPGGGSNEIHSDEVDSVDSVYIYLKFVSKT